MAADETEHEDRAGMPPGPDAGPHSPTQLSWRSWWLAIRRTVTEFREDNLGDWAAALTYYGVLSIFPGLLVLVAVVGLLGPSTSAAIIDNLAQLTPGSARDILTTAAADLQRHRGAAGLVAVFGLLVAVWSASGYVRAFMRAANAIYDVPEGRPVWKTVPLRVGVTVLAGVMLTASLLIVVLTGRVAEQVGSAFGVESTAVAAWDVLKWPVLLAVLLWLALSGLFAVYAANVGSYSRTYGALASVIAFLVWLWLSNLALLLGAELDAELERQRVVAAGHPADLEPYLQLRDSRKVDKSKDAGLG